MEPAAAPADRRRLYAAAAVVSLLPLSHGLAPGWGWGRPEPASPAEALPCWPSLAAAATAALCLEYAARRWGRRPVGLAAAGLHAAAALASALSPNPGTLLAARALSAAAGAAGLLFAPLYIREAADDTARGPLAVLLSAAAHLGLLVACSVPAAAAAYAALCPPLLFAVALPCLPETPVYLLRRGREQEAERALRWLRGDRAAEQLDTIVATLKATEQGRPATACVWRELAGSRAARKGLLILAILAVNQQLSGLYPVLSHGALIFREAGSGMTASAAAAVLSAMLTLGSAACAGLVTLCGRKRLLIVSNAVMALGLYALGLYLHLQRSGVAVQRAGWLPVASVCVFAAGFCAGPGSLLPLLATELFAARHAGAALALLGPALGALSLAAVRAYPAAAAALGLPACYWFSACACVACAGALAMLLPESRARPLQEVLRQLEGRGSVLAHGPGPAPAARRASYGRVPVCERHALRKDSVCK